MKKPNILFLMCDEHRFDVTGYSGNDVIRTPNLDYLANTGVVFDNAYTPSPICIPARQCMMSGQYSKKCDCHVFGDDLKPGYMTFARQFAKYAYKTTCCGKLHHTGIDQMQGWTKRIGMETNVTARYIDDKDDDSFDKFSVLVKDVKWSQTKEVKRAGIGSSDNKDADNYSVEGALLYIDKYFNDSWYDRENKKQPLMLKVSLNKPHYPYFADAEKFGYYLNRVQPYYEKVTFNHPALTPHKIEPGVDASEREIRRATAAYYSNIEEADEQFGRVLDKLRYVGENLDDWIIVYTSDHGEMLGQHGVWEKQKFYEASARVPLIIRYPKKFSHRVVKENVNLCDLFATLCEMAEIPVPDDLQSRNLIPLMEGNAENWDNESLSQFKGKHLMIKRDNLKYQYYGENLPDMLFDLEKNPEENIDFIDCPEYKDAVEKFRKRRIELKY